MYLKNFGLAEPPFSITPATGFFYSGAGRGEMLEALIYAATHGDGIVKVTSEVGSGKTMLCRMLLENLPENVETIYLPNPAVSREEVICAVADELGLDSSNLRPASVLRQVQDVLIEKYAEGRSVLVMIDEAHAMPCETLEELRLLYNLESSRHKLLKLILFGQPELDEKLDLPRMRQLKDRIVHHFSVKPLSADSIGDYLGFRVRMAGYTGASPFSTGAEKLIFRASRGFMRRINILADKSLLAAYVDGSGTVGPGHARAAIRDSGHKSAATARVPVMLLLLLLLGTPVAVSEPVMPEKHDVVETRLRVSLRLLQRPAGYTIRLMEIGRDRRHWLYRFLNEAGSAIDVNSIYIYPVKVGGIDKYLVVYGAYPSRTDARKALKTIPESYRKAYHPVIRRFPKFRIAYS